MARAPLTRQWKAGTDHFYREDGTLDEQTVFFVQPGARIPWGPGFDLIVRGSAFVPAFLDRFEHDA